MLLRGEGSRELVHSGVDSGGADDFEVFLGVRGDVAVLVLAAGVVVVVALIEGGIQTPGLHLWEEGLLGGACDLALDQMRRGASRCPHFWSLMKIVRYSNDSGTYKSNLGVIACARLLESSS